MTFRETGDVQLFVRSMGRLLRVTAMFDSSDEANAYMEKHKDQAVVAEIPAYTPLILLANVHDKGQWAEKSATTKQRPSTRQP